MTDKLPPLDEWIKRTLVDCGTAGDLHEVSLADLRDRIDAERVPLEERIKGLEERLQWTLDNHMEAADNHAALQAQRELIREVMALLNNTRRWFPKDGGGMFQLPPSDPIPDACYRSNAELQRALRDLAKQKGLDP